MNVTLLIPEVHLRNNNISTMSLRAFDSILLPFLHKLKNNSLTIANININNETS